MLEILYKKAKYEITRYIPGFFSFIDIIVWSGKVKYGTCGIVYMQKPTKIGIEGHAQLCVVKDVQPGKNRRSYKK